MTRQFLDDNSQVAQRQKALSRWDNEGGAAGSTLTSADDTEQIPVPKMTNAEIVALRVRVIALENLMIAALAEGSDRQRRIALDMGGGTFLPDPASRSIHSRFRRPTT